MAGGCRIPAGRWPRGGGRLYRRAALSVVAGTTGLAMTLAAALGGARPAGAALPGPERVGSLPPVPRGATFLGRLAPSTPMTIDVLLAPRDPGALAAFATAVATPGSPLYGHYLRRGQFAGRFGPTAAAIDEVTGSLERAGLSGGRLSANHLSIQYSASAARLAKVFAVAFDRYRLPGGRVAFANTEPPRLAGAAAAEVQGVVGLDDLAQAQPLDLLRPALRRPMAPAPHVVTGGPQPCAAAVSAGPPNDAYTADQLASAYRFSSLYGAGDEGAGISVALFELEPDKTSDIAAYQSCYGTSATVTYTKEDGGAGSGAGAGEAALDIEDVIGLAPKASIDVYQAPNTTTGLLDDYTAIVSNDTSKVVSTSWGECEAEAGSTLLSEENTLFQQAASQGQSVFAAAGDDGSEDCGTSALAVDDPSSQPYVTGVGGTEITALGPPPTEIVWNEAVNGAGAGGGGISSSHAMPSYQSGAPASLEVVNSHSSGTPCKAASGSYCREVPDVSADADPYSGYVIYYGGSWTGIGGTSAAAPLWAAFTALTDASSTCAGNSIGFADPALYSAAATAYSADFDDITSGNNDYTGTNGGLYPAGPGYDMASGLGTPNGAGLPGTLCAPFAGPARTTTSLAVSPPAPVVGQAVTFTATVGRVAPATGTPIGTVTISGDAGTLCSATLDEESPDRAQCSATYEATGSDSVTATYGGDADDLGSASSPAVGVSIAPAATTVALSTGTATPVVGQPVTFTATVAAGSPGSGTPTGSVTFTGGAGALCASPLDQASPDQATCTVSYGSAGSDSVTASYAGSADYASSVSGPVAETVTAASTTTAISSSPASPVVGQTVTYTATVKVSAPGAGTPAGTVVFTGDAGTICTTTLDAASPDTASCTTAYPTSAGDSVTAAYGGSTSFGASTSPPLDQSVSPDATTTSLRADDTTPVVGQPVTFTATVSVASPGSGTPIGTVTFTGGGGVLCSQVRLSGSSPDTATCSTTYDAPGSDSVTATYGGDTSDDGSASSALSVEISPAATATTLVTSSSSAVVGQTVVFTATVTPTAPGAGTPAGSVSFVGAAGTLCTSSIGAGGEATCTTSYDATGSDSVTATYGGSADFSASASPAVAVTISAAATTTTLSEEPASSVVGQEVTFTAAVATVSPGGGVPIGTVTFAVSSSTLCTAALSDTVPDEATCTVSFGTTGTRTVTATFGGSADDTASVSGSVTESVSAARTTTSIGSSASPSVTGEAVTFTAVVAAVAPSTGGPTGDVLFSVEGSGGQTFTCGGGDRKVLGSGTARCKIAGRDLSPSVSPLSVTAKFEGTKAYSSSTGTAGQDVERATTAVTVSSSVHPSKPGEAVTFTVSVRAVAPGGGTPTGSVTFGFSPAGSLACSGGDTVDLTTTARAVCSLPKNVLERSVTVTASYAGSSAYEPGSGSLSQTVT